MITIIPLVFSQKFAVVTVSLSTLLTSIFILIYPYVFQGWITEHGWRHSLVYIACIVMQCTVVAALVPSRSRITHPARRDAATGNTTTCPVPLRPRCVCLYAITSFGVMSNAVLFTLAVDYILFCGYTIDQAVFALFMFGIGSLLARLIAIPIGIPFPNISIHMLTESVAMRVVCSFVLAFSNEFSVIVTCLFVIGVGWGFHLCFLVTSTADVVRLYDIAFMPTVMGIVTLVLGVTICVGPLSASKYRYYNQMCIAFQFITFHPIVLHCIALHCMALHYIALHCIALHCIALHCITLHCIALHCIALHCIALHCIASVHCIALH